MQSVGQWIRCRFPKNAMPTMTCPFERASLWPTPNTNAIQRIPETRYTFRLQEGTQVISVTVRSAVNVYDEYPED